jgi:hypothetical protein
MLANIGKCLVCHAAYVYRSVSMQSKFFKGLASSGV